MPYITERIVHDADAHIMEAPGWLSPWIEDEVREALEPFTRVDPEAQAYLEKTRAPYSDPQFRVKDEEEITLRKGFAALGAFDKTERPKAVDLLGVASQLVFTTGGLRPLAVVERGDDVDLAHAVARGHNRVCPSSTTLAVALVSIPPTRKTACLR